MVGDCDTLGLLTSGWDAFARRSGRTWRSRLDRVVEKHSFSDHRIQRDDPSETGAFRGESPLAL